MTKPALQISFIEQPRLDLIGMCVRTDMQNAATDCPNLWHKTFWPRAAEIAGGGEPQGPSYGLSFMIDDNAFDYCAALPAPAGRPVPQGMQHVELPAGLYAGCRAPSLAQIGEAYTFLFMEWLPQQTEYALNAQAPTFERYDELFLQDGSFEIFMPVIRR